MHVTSGVSGACMAAGNAFCPVHMWCHVFIEVQGRQHVCSVPRPGQPFANTMHEIHVGTLQFCHLVFAGFWSEERWEAYKSHTKLEPVMKIIHSFMNDSWSGESVLSMGECLAPALIWQWQEQQQSQHNIRFVRLLASDLSDICKVAHTLQQYPRVKFVVYCDSMKGEYVSSAHSGMHSTLKGKQQSVHVYLFSMYSAEAAACCMHDVFLLQVPSAVLHWPAMLLLVHIVCLTQPWSTGCL